MTVVDEPEVGNGQSLVPASFNTANLSALIAAAQKLDFNSDADKRRYRKRQKGWQDEAWRYYDECPEIHFGVNFIGNCLRKVRLFAAVQPDKSEPPVPVEDEIEEGDALPEQAQLAVDLVERLGNADGGIGGIMAGFGLNLSVPGECVLFCEQIPLGERWAVRSSDELFVNETGKWALRTSPGDKYGKPIGPNDLAYRVWRQHPRWHDQADSAMRPLLDTIEELLILSRAIRASGRSRLAGAGLLLWPQEAGLTPQSPSSAGGTQIVSEQPVDPVLADLMQAMMTPIGDEGVAAAVVPLLMRMPAQYIESVKHLLFERPVDPEMAKQRDELRKRIATGLDIPAEVLLGLQDSNHWTAWMIDEQTFKSHLEPLVVQICSSLTSNYLLPSLGIMTMDETDLCVWYDAGALIGHPNRGQDTKDAWDRYLLSDDAARRYLGFSDEDEPDPEEVLARVSRKALERLGPLRSGEVLGEAVNVSAQEQVEPGIPATGPEAGSTPVPESLAAAAGRSTRLGWRLAHRDRDLRTRLLEATNAAMFRALERAGATLRRHTSKDATLKAMLVDIPNHEVGARLGPEAVLALGIDTEEMLADSFDNLSMRFDREVRAAQAEARDVMADFDEEEDLDMEAIAQQQGEHRREAAVLLAAALLALANARMFQPHPEAPPLGEHDPEMLVPSGYLREALAIAGGAPPPAALDGVVEEPVGGVLTGDLITSVWNQLGVGPQGYEWFVGAPSVPFEPHQDLDGVQFESFSDEVLAADAGEFPFVDFYHPGDHFGCQCDFAPILGSG